MDSKAYIFVFILSLLLSFVLTPLATRLAQWKKWLDHPGNRKQHIQPVAYLGGISIFAAIIFSFLLAQVLGFFSNLEIHTFQKIAIILACSLGLALVGLWDDLFKIRPLYKFLGQFFFTSIFAVYGFRFEVMHVPGFLPFALGFMAVPFTVFWLLSIINALNMVDGVDGLASTVMVGSFFLGCAASALVDNPSGLLLGFAALGGILGFLKFNWSPAKIYLGDAGSNGLGLLLAGMLVSLSNTQTLLSIHGHSPNLNEQVFPYQVFVITLLAAYPSLEIILTVARRFLHGRPISRADRGHLHHRMLNLGFQKKWICVIALAFTLLTGMGAISIIGHQYGMAIWLLVTSGILLGIALTLLGFLNFLSPHIISFSRPHFIIAHHFISMQRAKLSLAIHQEDVLQLINQVCVEFGVQGYSILVPPDAEGKGDCHITQERTHEDNGDYLNGIKAELKSGNFSQFKDHVSHKASGGVAEWIFDPHNQEEDLDVEYRVLVSEFMKEALECIASLKPSVHSGFVGQIAPDRLTSNLLRRRHRSKDFKNYTHTPSVHPPENPGHN